MRAQMIAQTETIRSSNAGAVMSYQKAGIEQKQWYTAQDDKVCEFCGEMHGKIVGTAENFWNLGDVMKIDVEDKDPISMTFGYEDVHAPPLHVNCRCTILPVVDEV